jgi:hydrogenase maturation protease
VKPGDRVRLRPAAGGDIFDLALTGRVARVEAIEHDFEGRCHIGVTIDDDPGHELGRRRQPGHHFFFSPEEIEPLDDARDPDVAPRLRVLVAGIGNVFKGDDGFGVEVAQRLAQRPHPAGVRIFDAGLRGFDLAYALLDGPDYTILIDVSPRGLEPGTVFLLEPDFVADAGQSEGATVPNAHDMDPVKVVLLARSLGATPRNVVVVGCEPFTFGPEEGHLGLSVVVDAAVPEAVAMVERLIQQFIAVEPVAARLSPQSA